MTDGFVTPSQVASWYHSKILRIPHDTQNPTKRYLDDDQVLELFDGTVAVQEKVDGKLAWDYQGDHLMIYEDMTGKHTVHSHVMHYKDLPVDKKIVLDTVRIDTSLSNLDRVFKVVPHVNNSELNYAVIRLHKPSIFHIKHVLRALSYSSSHFGSNVIEGIVVKNYDKQMFGKWINDDFEDLL